MSDQKIRMARRAYYKPALLVKQTEKDSWVLVFVAQESDGLGVSIRQGSSFRDVTEKWTQDLKEEELEKLAADSPWTMTIKPLKEDTDE